MNAGRVTRGMLEQFALDSDGRKLAVKLSAHPTDAELRDIARWVAGCALVIDDDPEAAFDSAIRYALLPEREDLQIRVTSAARALTVEFRQDPRDADGSGVALPPPPVPFASCRLTHEVIYPWLQGDLASLDVESGPPVVHDLRLVTACHTLGPSCVHGTLGGACQVPVPLVRLQVNAYPAQLAQELPYEEWSSRFDLSPTGPGMPLGIAVDFMAQGEPLGTVFHLHMPELNPQYASDALLLDVLPLAMWLLGGADGDVFGVELDECKPELPRLWPTADRRSPVWNYYFFARLGFAIVRFDHELRREFTRAVEEGLDLGVPETVVMVHMVEEGALEYPFRDKADALESAWREDFEEAGRDGEEGGDGIA